MTLSLSLDAIGDTFVIAPLFSPGRKIIRDSTSDRWPTTDVVPSSLRIRDGTKVNFTFALISRINDKIDALKPNGVVRGQGDQEPNRRDRVRGREGGRDRVKGRSSAAGSAHRAGANKLRSRVKGERERDPCRNY